MEEAGWGDEGAPEWKEPECHPASSQPPHLPPIAPGTDVALIPLGTPQRNFPGDFCPGCRVQKTKGLCAASYPLLCPYSSLVPLCLPLPASAHFCVPSASSELVRERPSVSDLVSKMLGVPAILAGVAPEPQQDSSVLQETYMENMEN